MPLPSSVSDRSVLFDLRALAKDAGVELLLSADNPGNTMPAAPMPKIKAYPKNTDVEAAAVQLADALYPIVRQLDAKTVAPVASKVIAQASGFLRPRESLPWPSAPPAVALASCHPHLHAGSDG